MNTIADRAAYLRAVNPDGVSVLEGTAEWCVQCKTMAPVLQKFIDQFPEARFYQYDVEKAVDVAQELGVRQMPSFHVFKDGELMDSITGAKPKELEKAIRDNYTGEVNE